MVLRVTWVWWQTEESGFPHPPFLSSHFLLTSDDDALFFVCLFVFVHSCALLQLAASLLFILKIEID
jgi:hypothetical protein